MEIYSKFDTDTESEIAGVWVNLGEGASVKVARLGNSRHKELVKKQHKPYQASIQAGLDLPDDLRTSLTIEAMAETILLDWKGIKGRDKKDIPYSTENAKKVLTDLRDFRDTIAYLASQQETFRKSALEEAEKN